MTVAYTLRINGICTYITAQQLAPWNVADATVMACDWELSLCMNSRILCTTAAEMELRGALKGLGSKNGNSYKNH